MKTLIPNGNQSIFNKSKSVQRIRQYHQDKVYKKLDEQSSIILKLLV